MATYSATPIAVELVTPEELLFSGEVEMVVIPGVEGDFGVLYGHEPLISIIRPGIISLYKYDNTIERLFISGGFAEVTNVQCTILAEEALPIDALTHAMVDTRLQKARKMRDKSHSDIDKAIAEKEIAIAEAMLLAI
jgi:F-type H+-transporting ATPase subunit epsilon